MTACSVTHKYSACVTSQNKKCMASVAAFPLSGQMRASHWPGSGKAVGYFVSRGRSRTVTCVTLATTGKNYRCG